MKRPSLKTTVVGGVVLLVLAQLIRPARTNPPIDPSRTIEARTNIAPEVLEILAGRNVGLCLYDFAGQQAPLEVTADFVYIRLHGPKGPYRGSYGDAALRTWAKRIRGWAEADRDVYCFFDNDDSGHAPKNALRLRGMLA